MTIHEFRQKILKQIKECTNVHFENWEQFEDYLYNQSTANFIKEISKCTGLNFFDYLSNLYILREKV